MSKKHLSKPTHLKLLLFFSTIAIFISAFYIDKYLTRPKVSGVVSDGGSVTVSSSIYSCLLNLNIKPEKRIPTNNNWQTWLDVEVYNLDNQFLGRFSEPTNNLGNLRINICSRGIHLRNATYDFYIRSTSSLRKLYTQGGFKNAESSINFSSINGDLLAGETSNVYDNYVNVLDFSTQLNKLYATDNLNDLNQEGQVNALDLSNTLINFYLKGNCSPNELQNNICD